MRNCFVPPYNTSESLFSSFVFDPFPTIFFKLFAAFEMTEFRNQLVFEIYVK